MAPLWVVRIVKSHRKVSKIEVKLGIRSDHPKGMFYAFLLGFGRKIGLNLNEDPFVFCSLPNFERKIGVNLSEDIFFSLHQILDKKRTEFK